MSDCLHRTIFELRCKGVDSFTWRTETRGQGYSNTSGPDYAPEIPGLCRGDYLKVRICLDCREVIDLDTDDIRTLILEKELEDESSQEREAD